MPLLNLNRGDLFPDSSGVFVSDSCDVEQGRWQPLFLRLKN